TRCARRSSGTPARPSATSPTTGSAARSSTARDSLSKCRRYRTAPPRPVSTGRTSSIPPAASVEERLLMSILTEDQAKAILEKVIALSKADEVTAVLAGARKGNIRFALNNITTSGIVEDLDLFVTSSFGTRSGTTTANQFDDASLERAVRRSEELA